MQTSEIEARTSQTRQSAGIATIAMEDNDRTAGYRADYPVVTAVQPDTDLQEQCNRQTLDSFASYKPEMAFPKIR